MRPVDLAAVRVIKLPDCVAKTQQDHVFPAIRMNLDIVILHAQVQDFLPKMAWQTRKEFRMRGRLVAGQRG